MRVRSVARRVCLSYGLPLVSDNKLGLSRRVPCRRRRCCLGRAIVLVFVLRMLGQHLFGAVQRIGLPNAAAVPIQVVVRLSVVAATAAALVGVHVRLLLVGLLLLVTRNRSTATTTDHIAAAASHAPIAVVVRVLVVVAVVRGIVVAVVLPVVVVVMAHSMTTNATTTAAAHLLST